jgi:hypothetical protein
MTNDPSRISCTYLLFWWIIMDYISRAAVTINAVFSFCPVQIHEKKCINGLNGPTDAWPL